jgi:hypothetical protein
MAGVNLDADHPLKLGDTMLGSSEISYMTFKPDFLPASVSKAEKGVLLQDIPKEKEVSATYKISMVEDRE